MINRWVLVFASLVLANAAFAQDAHRDAAIRFHRLMMAHDSSTTTQVVAAAMARVDPTLARYPTIVQEWLRDQISSREYEEAKVAVYMHVYSVGELNQLVQLVQLPAFQLMQRKHQETLRLSAPELVKLAQRNAPELERRIKAAEANERK